MWDVANNSAPENIKRAFTRISEVHSYPTRSSLNDDFYTEHSRLEKMRSSFLRVGPKIWNSLPSDMRNLPKSTFRKMIWNKLFEILSKSDALGEQGWRSGESARLPSMWPGFKPRCRYVGWICCWFPPLLREVFLRVLRFSPLPKNQHFQIPIRSGTHGHWKTSS